jgi:hypothetical protein
LKLRESISHFGPEAWPAPTLRPLPTVPIIMFRISNGIIFTALCSGADVAVSSRVSGLDA